MLWYKWENITAAWLSTLDTNSNIYSAYQPSLTNEDFETGANHEMNENASDRANEDVDGEFGCN